MKLFTSMAFVAFMTLLATTQNGNCEIPCDTPGYEKCGSNNCCIKGECALNDDGTGRCTD